MNLVINPTKCTESSITASNKIAKWIAGLLKIKLVDDKLLAKAALDFQIETVFVVNGMFGFCDFRDEIAKICKKAASVIWIGNDYALTIPSFLNEVKLKSSFRRIAQYSNFNSLRNHKIVDFNKLLHFQGELKPHSKNGLFYYGAFRKNRTPVFKHWFSKSEVPIHISTGVKNIPDFKRINPTARFYTPNGDIRQFISDFQSSIYIEDELKNKSIFYTPANRFYEVIGSKTLLLFDVRSKQTLSRAGYWSDEFAVSSISDVKEKLKRSAVLQHRQISMFEDRDFKAELDVEFLQSL